MLWVLDVVGLYFHIFTGDENWLYPCYGIDGGFIANGLLSIAYMLVGLTLLQKPEARSV